MGTFFTWNGKNRLHFPHLWYNHLDIYTIGDRVDSSGVEVLNVEKAEFSSIRKKLGKTQKQLAALLGMSLKTIHSYEQGWRSIPAHIERQLFFLLINQRKNKNELIPCWEQKAPSFFDSSKD